MEGMSSTLNVGLWYKTRTVVYDSEQQPDNSDFMFLYFVEGPHCHDSCPLP